MGNVSSLLSDRFKKESSGKVKKMNELARRGAAGDLTSFSGVFKVQPLTDGEKETIETILVHYGKKKSAPKSDLVDLFHITSELKAINNQAIILHGERIKKAQTILKKYKDGAFTAWLMTTYGNRQTPYNFLQYYEFYRSLPALLKEKMDELPKQAIYTLASREGEKARKEEFIRSYKGEPKHIVLEKIRKIFPLSKRDKRRQNLAGVATTTLKKLHEKILEGNFTPSPKQKTDLNYLLSQIFSLVNDGETPT